MKTLMELTGELAQLPTITALASRIARPGGALLVAPLITAARAPVVAALATGAPAACLLYVAGSSDQAVRAAEDLRLWTSPARVVLYPASDAMPYEHMSPGADVLGQRLSVLQRLRDRPISQSLVVVTSVRALMQPTLTPDELSFATVELRRGAELAQDALIRRWIEQGYRVAPTVEEPGELNRRGGIVDIWPTADPAPLRIEWFGDEIDSLRRFTPATQRSEQRLDAALIGPPHEIPLWRRARALERLRAIDTGSLRREARDDWQAALGYLELGERFEGRAFYAPFFREQGAGSREQRAESREQRAANGEDSGMFAVPCSLLSHLPGGAAVLLSEANMLAHLAAELHEQAEAQRAALVEAGELPSAFPRPYMLWPEIFGQPLRVTLVDLSNNDLPAADRETADGQPSNPQPATFQPAISNLQSPHFVPPDLFGGQFRRLVGDIVGRLREGERVVVVTPQAARVQELVEEALHTDDSRRAEDSAASSIAHGLSSFSAIHGALDAGWRLPELTLTLYTDTEIFGWRQRRPLAERRRRKERSAEERAAFLRGLKPGDYVVHIEHGIALYEGLIRRRVGEVEREYLNLRYAAGDRLYVPVDQVDRVARYIGAGDAVPQLTRLDTQEWERAKRKARAAVQDLANDLLILYAQRQLTPGHAFSLDNEWQRELEASFPYIETDDQLRALSEVKADMEQPHPMDRLICGDVGFGKTEVALRAAFKAVQDGKQVAILVPTTVLAQQHYDTFTRRMAAFPLAVEMLSRFRSPREQDEILKRLLRGGVDIIIGTHRLLSKDVVFKDLGLVIVDEEQRFGVRHKERLKQLRAEVDVLTLTATPIPRTLHMSLAGIRDLSVIDTPPEDRVPIKTYVAPYDDNLIRDAIRRELDRGGQVYFVHNRVHSIYHVANHLQHLVPEAEVAVGHGQMEEKELERVMFEFFNGQDDVLVCTTIIESGLDVPNANTIIIDDATHYGLAQLYQLRGRVGRSANRAYAYLLYRPERTMTEEAQQRLQAIQEATELGAGFRIAMRDLEIRGAGNLLGAEQSGHIAAVGFDLYSRLLEQAVTQLKEKFHASRNEEKAGRPGDRETGRPGDDGASDAELKAQISPSGSAGRPLKVKVDERVLVSPLVTLDLPLTAYLPEDYITDETVRLAVYQRMVEAQTSEEVRALRQELRDRFGEPPGPALHLLTWLRIKALALSAGVNSVVTAAEEFIVRLPIIDASMRERLRRRYSRDASVKIGPQFIRLDRRELKDKWVEKLTGVLEVLGS